MSLVSTLLGGLFGAGRTAPPPAVPINEMEETMGVHALEPGYESKVPVLDKIENFHGNQLVYLHWEEHLMFCAALAFPFPPDMPFGALIAEILPTFYGMHPDFARIDWAKVRWQIDGKDVRPDPEKSLKANGVGHKSLIRFWTPGLNGVGGVPTV